MCENCLSEALFYNPNSFDALIQISNLRILRKRDEEALSYMEKIYNFALNCINNNDENNLPSQDILLNLSKNYAELGHHPQAIKLLDILVKSNDEDLECWYLLAFNHYTIKNYKYSSKCIKNFKLTASKVPSNSKTADILELEDAAKELETTLEEIKKSQGELTNSHEEGEDYEFDKEEEKNEEDQMTID